MFVSEEPRSLSTLCSWITALTLTEASVTIDFCLALTLVERKKTNTK
jgi:hypothetical protein